MSWLVAGPRIFRLFMKGKFDPYVLCVTFGQKSSKLNSRPVYCSQLYGKCCTLGYNTISNEGNLKETLIKIVLLRNSYCSKQYCAGFMCIKESEIKSKKTTNVRWCNLLVCLHSTSWYTIVWQKGIQDEFQMGPFVLLQTYGKLYDSIKKWMMWHHEPCAALFVWKKTPNKQDPQWSEKYFEGAL